MNTKFCLIYKPKLKVSYRNIGLLQVYVSTIKLSIKNKQ